MKKWILLALVGLIIVVVAGMVMEYRRVVFAKEGRYTDQSLMLIAKDSPGPNCDVYIYTFRDGAGGYYLFAVTSRNFKDGVAITQLK